MNITLIKPPNLASKNGYSSIGRCPPIGLVELGTYIQKKGHNVTIIDSQSEDSFEHNFFHEFTLCGKSFDTIISEIPVDTQVIGVSCQFSTEWVVYKRLCNLIKENFPEIPLIIGGEHSTADYEYILKECKYIDYCIIGEGEYALEYFLEYLQGKIKKTELPGIAYLEDNLNIIKTSSRRILDENEFVWPNWELIDIEGYLTLKEGSESWGRRTMPIYAARGCPYKCTFCTNEFMWGSRVISRSVNKVIKQISEYKRVYNIDHIEFYDWAGMINKRWILTFCREVIKLKLNLTYNFPAGTRSEIIDKDTIKLLNEAGFTNILFAPETGSAKTSLAINKKINLSRLLKKIDFCKKNGMRSGANFILGFPDESFTEILKSLLFIYKCLFKGLDDLLPYVFSPYPGSILHNEIVKKGGINKTPGSYELFLATSNYNDLNPNAIYSFFKTIFLWITIRILIISFYGIQTLIRPSRLLSSFRNIYNKRPCGFLEVLVSKTLSNTFPKYYRIN